MTAGGNNKQLEHIRRELREAIEDGDWDLVLRIIEANPDVRDSYEADL